MHTSWLEMAEFHMFDKTSMISIAITYIAYKWLVIFWILWLLHEESLQMPDILAATQKVTFWDKEES